MVTSPSDLHELAVRSQRLAQDATLLAWLEDETLNYLSPGRPVSVLVADTLFAERYNDLTACLAWLSGAYRLWLRANQRFIGEAGRQIFYRFVLLPIPRVLKSWPIRRLLIDTILLHLHVQLWHGVVCGISFVDPRSSRTKRQLRDLNFVAIPAHRTVFDTPAYYHVEELGTKVLVDSVADIRCAEFREIIGRSPIWLWYDQKTFSDQRLSGSRWRSLREFFACLYGPRIRCLECGNILTRWALDHIAPVSRGYPQTLVNMRPLCIPCNSSKGALLAEDPFRAKLLLPDELLTRELEDILRLPPPWIGTVSSPSHADIARGGKLNVV